MEISSWCHHCSFFFKLALPPFYPYLPPTPPTFSTLSRSHNHLGDHFASASLFKTLFPLSITWRSFRSVVWSNAPQRCTWNRGHAPLIHHFPSTIAPLLPESPPPTLVHSCTLWSLFIHVLSHSSMAPHHSFLISWLSHAHLSQRESSPFSPVHLQPHNAFSATKHYLTTHTYKLCNCKKHLPCVSFQKSMADMDKCYILKWLDAYYYYFITLNLHFVFAAPLNFFFAILCTTK